MTQTASSELRRMRLLLGDAAAEIHALPAITTVTRVGLLQMIAQAEKAAERAVKLAREEPR